MEEKKVILYNFLYNPFVFLYIYYASISSKVNSESFFNVLNPFERLIWHI